MPKTKLQKYVKELKKPRLNNIEMTIHGYMRAQNLTSEMVGEKLGLTGSGFRRMINRPEESWTIKDIRRVCDAVNCPVQEIYQLLSKCS